MRTTLAPVRDEVRDTRNDLLEPQNDHLELVVRRRAPARADRGPWCWLSLRPAGAPADRRQDEWERYARI